MSNIDSEKAIKFYKAFKSWLKISGGWDDTTCWTRDRVQKVFARKKRMLLAFDRVEKKG